MAPKSSLPGVARPLKCFLVRNPDRSALGPYLHQPSYQPPEEIKHDGPWALDASTSPAKDLSAPTATTISVEDGDCQESLALKDKITRARRGDWIPAKRVRFVRDILKIGYHSADFHRLSRKYNICEGQLRHEMCPGRKNLRSHIIAMAKKTFDP